MIEVHISKNRIAVRGHADTAPKGSDIVCAGVSALTLTLLRGLKNIANMAIYERVAPGNVCVEWQTANDTGKALVDTWYLGMLGIAETSPGTINFQYGDQAAASAVAFFNA